MKKFLLAFGLALSCTTIYAMQEQEEPVERDLSPPPLSAKLAEAILDFNPQGVAQAIEAGAELPQTINHSLDDYEQDGPLLTAVKSMAFLKSTGFIPKTATLRIHKLIVKIILERSGELSYDYLWEIIQESPHVEMVKLILDLGQYSLDTLRRCIDEAEQAHDEYLTIQRLLKEILTLRED